MHLVKNFKKMDKDFTCDSVLAKETRGMFAGSFWERAPCLKKVQGKGILFLEVTPETAAHPGPWELLVWGQNRDDHVQTE